VRAVDLAAGETAWIYADPERPFPFYSSPAIAGDRIVIGGRDKRLHAIDRKTGRGLWTYTTQGRVNASPVIVGERVFAASADGSLFAVDLASGKELWSFDTGSGFEASPAIGHQRLVIGTVDGTLYCFG
jgi:outer membrane protein assembly factor BamB